MGPHEIDILFQRDFEPEFLIPRHVLRELCEQPRRGVLLVGIFQGELYERPAQTFPGLGGVDTEQSDVEDVFGIQRVETVLQMSTKGRDELYLSFCFGNAI